MYSCTPSCRLTWGSVPPTLCKPQWLPTSLLATYSLLSLFSTFIFCETCINSFGDMFNGKVRQLVKDLQLRARESVREDNPTIPPNHGMKHSWITQRDNGPWQPQYSKNLFIFSLCSLTNWSVAGHTTVVFSLSQISVQMNRKKKGTTFRNYSRVQWIPLDLELWNLSGFLYLQLTANSHYVAFR